MPSVAEKRKDGRRKKRNQYGSKKVGDRETVEEGATDEKEDRREDARDAFRFAFFPPL